MTGTATPFAGLLRLSIRRPQEGARAILALGLSAQAIWLGLAVTVIIGTLLGYVHEAVTPEVLDKDGNPMRLPGPFVSVVITATLLIALDFVTAHVGRGFGGTGSFMQILLVDIWLRVIALIAMGLDIIAYLIDPQIGQIVLFATYIYMFWLMVNFVAQAHGGLSLGRSLLVIVLSALITLLPFLFLLSLFGVTPTIGA